MPTRALSPLYLLAAVVVACIAACSSGERDASTRAAPGRGVYIPVEWHEARTTTGHRVHVTEHQVACTKCHELAGSNMSAVSPVRCRSCHEKEAAISHAAAEARKRFGPDAKADCTVCHVFAAPKLENGASAALAHAVASSAALDATALPAADGGDAGVFHAVSSSDCLRCHRVAQGHAPAVTVHDKGSDCLRCHRPHEDATPKPAPCLTCHESAKFSHAAHGGEGGCKDCHASQHGKAAEALGTCTTCHASHEPIVPASALFESGHKACVDCHQPHQFEKALVKPCRSCHENVHVLGETKALLHQQCTSCHKPHDVRGSAMASCVGCHATVHPDHPKLPGFASTALSCVGCHNPHPPPGSVHALAKACSTCHATAHSDVAFHRSTECVKCHVPHDFVMDDGGKALCHGCHEAKFTAVAPNKGHQNCASCHGGLPHEPASARQSCPTCHEKEHDRANKGHVACENCHEPHRGTVTEVCKDCHATEARTAPLGHSTCLNCHEQHSGAPDHAVCASCHAKEARTQHGQISPKCSSCHEPHGPAGPSAPPPCTTCHDQAKLPGLHSVGKHTECKDCHGGHDDPARAGRAPCLACHTDRASHFPDAPRCVSCHLFDGPRASGR